MKMRKQGNISKKTDRLYVSSKRTLSSIVAAFVTVNSQGPFQPMLLSLKTNKNLQLYSTEKSIKVYNHYIVSNVIP